MGLIRVWGNTYLNTDCVGKVEVDVKFLEQCRTTTTTVYNTTGQYVLLNAVSAVATDASASDPCIFERDNFFHDEIIKSIQEKRDAAKWLDPIDS